MVDTRLPEEEETLAEDNFDGEKNLTLIEHLDELRQRLFRAAIAVAVGFVVAFLFRDQLFELLTRPAQNSPVHFIVTEPAEAVSLAIKVALTAGLILAMPVVVYQAAMFDPLTAARLSPDRIVEMCDELIDAHGCVDDGGVLPNLDAKRTLVPTSGRRFGRPDPRALRASWEGRRGRACDAITD